MMSGAERVEPEVSYNCWKKDNNKKLKLKFIHTHTHTNKANFLTIETAGFCCTNQMTQIAQKKPYLVTINHTILKW